MFFSPKRQGLKVTTLLQAMYAHWEIPKRKGLHSTLGQERTYGLHTAYRCTHARNVFRQYSLYLSRGV